MLISLLPAIKVSVVYSNYYYGGQLKAVSVPVFRQFRASLLIPHPLLLQIFTFNDPCVQETAFPTKTECFSLSSFKTALYFLTNLHTS